MRRIWINRHWKLKREWMQELDDMELDKPLIWTRIQHSGKPGSWIDEIESHPEKISIFDHQINEYSKLRYYNFIAKTRIRPKYRIWLDPQLKNSPQIFYSVHKIPSLCVYKNPCLSIYHSASLSVQCLTNCLSFANPFFIHLTMRS